ncbi:MAG: D-alanyl-D-alanine carboxypeptidase [Clostridiales bacterium]|nr:D-alanyl-D-alanine carboxypeptidase family protein [Bacillota bacterium]NLK04067.1 D-alanyl-D-alanine carboxypeptidase [Clostridiales bacterium]
MKKNISLVFVSLIFLILLPKTIISANIKMTKPDVNDAIPVTAIVNSQMELDTPSAVLIEGSTGTVLYEKNKDEKLKPASVTKIMTLLLIFEAIDSGQISLIDDVTVSDHAASMGGSQVFLEPYEVQNVETMIKCISIASANDASVAMAEHIAGSEEEFVARMNARAKELGMNNTNFINCSGLDADNHYTTAYDIAIMSKELVTRFPQISNYSTVWMDTFVHTTRKGRTEFGLTNTNKLIKSYNGITGLKTGSTSQAKYCLSATARRNNMDLIAVIMAAPDTKTRFREAAKLLNYGFANYSIYVDDNKDIIIEPVRVTKGVSDLVGGKVKGDFSFLCSKGKSSENIRKELVLYDKVSAPVTIEDKIGEIIYYYDNEKIGSVDILALESIDKAGYIDSLVKSLKKFFIANK